MGNRQEQEDFSAPVVEWIDAQAGLSRDAIALNPDKRYQAILGFGGALTDTACFMLNQLSPAARAELFIANGVERLPDVHRVGRLGDQGL